MLTKTLFTFQIQSVSDIITNSSSELFVYQEQNKTLEDFKKLLDSIYPDWRTEYLEPTYVSKMSKKKKEDFIDWIVGYNYKTEWISYYDIPLDKFNLLKNSDILAEKDFPKLIGLTPEETYENWDSWCPVEKGDNCYNTYGDQFLNISKLAKKKYLEYCKNNNVIALWSKDENPNWDYQDKLETIATRYHLG